MQAPSTLHRAHSPPHTHAHTYTHACTRMHAQHTFTHACAHNAHAHLHVQTHMPARAHAQSLQKAREEARNNVFFWLIATVLDFVYALIEFLTKFSTVGVGCGEVAARLCAACPWRPTGAPPPPPQPPPATCKDLAGRVSMPLNCAGVCAQVRMAMTGEAFVNAGRGVVDLLARNAMDAFGVWWLPPLILQARAVACLPSTPA